MAEFYLAIRKTLEAAANLVTFAALREASVINITTNLAPPL
jgi:hypothetical protein